MLTPAQASTNKRSNALRKIIKSLTERLEKAEEDLEEVQLSCEHTGDRYSDGDDEFSPVYCSLCHAVVHN